MTKCDLTKKGLLLNFKRGLDYEYAALDTCGDLLKLLSDKRDKEKVRHIIKDEKKHIKITKKIISLVEKSYIKYK